MTEINQQVCICGHTAHWHGNLPNAPGTGSCEHDAECRCQRFRQPGTEISQEAVKCPFCDYAGPNPVVLESPNVYVIEPLNPVTPGHLLVIPRRHVEHFTDDSAVTANVMEFASRVVAPKIGDCNIITSKGPSATQTVRHLHVHVVPRQEGDGLALPWDTSAIQAQVLAQPLGDGSKWKGKTRDEVIEILEGRLAERGRELNEAQAQVLAGVRERLLSDEFLDDVTGAVISERAMGIARARREAVKPVVEVALATLNPNEGTDV